MTMCAPNIVHPAQMVCTDGVRIGTMPNPRTYGTYPKILGQIVRDEHLMPLEQAIRKMTSFPAQRFGLSDRGILRDGMAADIVVFDPTRRTVWATFENPRQNSLLMDRVLVFQWNHGGREKQAHPRRAGEPVTNVPMNRFRGLMCRAPARTRGRGVGLGQPGQLMDMKED
jgi:hypothetical protein